jgi:branched-chain amino acid transport system substrate-binding protein
MVMKNRLKRHINRIRTRSLGIMLGKSVHLLIVVLVVAALALTACGGDDKKSEEKAESILIGGTLCITGPQNSVDAPGLKGAELAVEELNRQGGILGRQVEFVNIDGQSDPNLVGEAALDLIERGAVAIIAPCDFDFGSPASQEAQKVGIVGLSTCASSPLYSSTILGDKQFTLSMWNTTMGAAAAEYAYVDRGWQTAFVITDTFLEYTISLGDYFSQQFESLGGTVLGRVNYEHDSNDFTAQLAALQALDPLPDVLYISSYMPDLAFMVRTVREAGIDVPIMGGDTYDDSSFFAALGPEYGNDVFFVTHSWMRAEASQEMARMLDLYQEKYGVPADTAFIATGWDAVMVIAQAMNKAGTTDGAAVAKAMEETEFVLLTGKLDWSSAAEGHQPDKDAALVELQNGVPSFIGWGRPETLPAP